MKGTSGGSTESELGNSYFSCGTQRGRTQFPFSDKGLLHLNKMAPFRKGADVVVLIKDIFLN